MKPRTDENRLSRMSTDWEGLAAAHANDGGMDEITAARNDVLMRYASCVYKYILGATKDADVADDLAQEFALRFVRGDFKNASPEKGRFRDYLKTSLRNLVTDHFRSKRYVNKTPSVIDSIAQTPQDTQLDVLEQEFQTHWRQQVLRLAWSSLKELEELKSNSYYTVLHLRANHSNLSSTELAKLFSADSHSPVTAEWVRQKLHRARQKFASIIMGEIRRSLDSHDEDTVQQELAELGLQKYLDA